jgi:hypothetical protein
MIVQTLDFLDPTAPQRGNDFLEQLQSFAGQYRLNAGESRDVPARPRQAVNQHKCNRIGHTQKNDGNRSGSILES